MDIRTINSAVMLQFCYISVKYTQKDKIQVKKKQLQWIKIRSNI